MPRAARGKRVCVCVCTRTHKHTHSTAPAHPRGGTSDCFPVARKPQTFKQGAHPPQLAWKGRVGRNRAWVGGGLSKAQSWPAWLGSKGEGLNFQLHNETKRKKNHPHFERLESPGFFVFFFKFPKVFPTCLSKKSALLQF